MDELIGFWENDLDDHSGLHTMIWGYGVEFLENNIGYIRNWGAGQHFEKDKVIFYWNRLDEKTIIIKDEFEVSTKINYEIISYTGIDKQNYYQLINSGMITFWDFPYPIYKRKNEN